MSTATAEVNVEPPDVVGAAIQYLALPALQAAAYLSILNFQKNEEEKKTSNAQRILEEAQKENCDCLLELLPLLRAAIDDIPKAAHYNPVNIPANYLEGLRDAAKMIEYVKEYADCWSESARDVDLARMRALNPLYDESQEKMWKQLASLICGETPVDVAIRISGDAAETNAINGRIGACNLTALKLGANSLSLQALGRSEKREEEQHLSQSVSPLERIPSFQQWIIDPAQRTQWDMQQATLVQNSLQNAYNLCAQKDPYLFQEWQTRFSCCQTKLQTAMAQASAELGFTPNYLGAFGPRIDSLFGNFRAPTTSNTEVIPQALPVTPSFSDAGNNASFK